LEGCEAAWRMTTKIRRLRSKEVVVDNNTKTTATNDQKPKRFETDKEHPVPTKSVLFLQHHISRHQDQRQYHHNHQHNHNQPPTTTTMENDWETQEQGVGDDDEEEEEEEEEEEDDQQQQEQPQAPPDLGLGGDSDDEDDDEDDDEEEEEDVLDMGGEDTARSDREALLMRFCPHDSSMLYPQVRFYLIEVQKANRVECLFLTNPLDWTMFLCLLLVSYCLFGKTQPKKLNSQPPFQQQQQLTVLTYYPKIILLTVFS
jgi:hypothetical protein